MSGKIVGCQSVEDFNRFLSAIQDLILPKKLVIHYSSGVWPNVKVNLLDIRDGDEIKDVEIADTQYLVTMVLSHIFTDEDKAVMFYEILRKYMVKWNIPFIPFFSLIVDDSKDLSFVTFIELPTEEWAGKSIVAWREYAATNDAISHRLRSNITPSGIFVDTMEAVAYYVQLLYMLIISPDITEKIKEDTAVKTTMITHAQPRKLHD